MEHPVNQTGTDEPQDGQNSPPESTHYGNPIFEPRYIQTLGLTHKSHAIASLQCFAALLNPKELEADLGSEHVGKHEEYRLKDGKSLRWNPSQIDRKITTWKKTPSKWPSPVAEFINALKTIKLESKYIGKSGVHAYQFLKRFERLVKDDKEPRIRVASMLDCLSVGKEYNQYADDKHKHGYKKHPFLERLFRVKEHSWLQCNRCEGHWVTQPGWFLTLRVDENEPQELKKLLRKHAQSKLIRHDCKKRLCDNTTKQRLWLGLKSGPSYLIVRLQRTTETASTPVWLKGEVLRVESAKPDHEHYRYRIRAMLTLDSLSETEQEESRVDPRHFSAFVGYPKESHGDVEERGEENKEASEDSQWFKCSQNRVEKLLCRPFDGASENNDGIVQLFFFEREGNNKEGDSEADQEGTDEDGKEVEEDEEEENEEEKDKRRLKDSEQEKGNKDDNKGNDIAEEEEEKQGTDKGKGKRSLSDFQSETDREEDSSSQSSGTETDASTISNPSTKLILSRPKGIKEPAWGNHVTLMSDVHSALQCLATLLDPNTLATTLGSSHVGQHTKVKHPAIENGRRSEVNRKLKIWSQNKKTMRSEGRVDLDTFPSPVAELLDVLTWIQDTTGEIRKPYIYAYRLLMLMARLTGRHDGTTLGDPVEWITDMLNCLSVGCTYAPSKGPKFTYDESDPVINPLFRVTQRGALQCKACSKLTCTPAYQSDWFLSLRPGSGRKIDRLSDMLASTFPDVYADQLGCECLASTQVTRWFGLSDAPHNLIVRIKEPLGSDEKQDFHIIIDNEISIPTFSVDRQSGVIKPAGSETYVLRGLMQLETVGEHKSVCKYTAYVRWNTAAGDQWWRCEDEFVTEYPMKAIETHRLILGGKYGKYPSLLFYQKLMPPTPTPAVEETAIGDGTTVAECKLGRSAETV
ncbi:hypothetical protein M011DRAFT_482855 [Sporormia fimetaria CBS 119925]|uniref:USP domain-containing protein n=1 Tax=Sporormia fimetaria CBS 119925 TaxID=1340428 RepID=A0A6A6VQE3_9PLEO|nr:hypothetical protein M011DRAFT_482855 [Sporormia fimetaria CBS 119925]